jgi:osmotically-inducible protein OsmY
MRADRKFLVLGLAFAGAVSVPLAGCEAQIDQAVAIANKVDGVTSIGNELSIKR